jgi:hypothetical protein
MTEPIQALDDLGAEFARVSTEAETRPRARNLAVAIAIATLVVGGAYSVPATRAAVDGIAETFASWVTGEGDKAPGRALEPGDNIPSWFRDDGEVRLIAKTDGVGLYVKRTDSAEGPRLEFGLGEGIALSVGASLESWRERLGRRAVVFLGSAPLGPQDFLDERGRVPLLGLTTRGVKRVELRYYDGPSLVGQTGDRAFVLLADAWRPLRELIAYDGTGRVVGRADMRDVDMRYLCDKEPGVCPPEAAGMGLSAGR